MALVGPTLQNAPMKYSISDVPLFKRTILSQFIDDIQQEVQRLSCDAGAQGDDTALLQELSDIATSQQELRRILDEAVPQQDGDGIEALSLFDFTVSTARKTKTTTFLVLPLASLGKLRPNLRIAEVSVTFLPFTHPLVGRKLNQKIRMKSAELWDEPNMGHVVMLGKFSVAATSWVSWIYR